MENNPAQNLNPDTNLPQPTQPTEPENSSLPHSKWLKIGIGVLLVILILGGTFVLGSKLMNKPQVSTPTLMPEATSTPTPTTNPTADWKTYTAANYSFKYPTDWFVNLYSDATGNGPFEVSDVQNSPTALLGASDIHTRIGISYSTNIMPTNFPLQNGDSSQNPTIKSFSANGYVGIRGDSGSTAGTIDNVLLKNSNGGYIWLQLTPSQQNSDVSKNIFDQILSTFKFTDSASEATQSFLEIPKYGVKFVLTNDIKDAYYLPSTADKGYVYLKVHALDSEHYCNNESSLGIAALNRVAKDEIDQRTGKKFSDSQSGSIVGNYYYFIDLEQAVCSQNLSNQTLETNARKAFSNASSTIKSL